MRVWSPAPVTAPPTAQALLAEVAATLNRELLDPRLGLATRFQVAEAANGHGQR